MSSGLTRTIKHIKHSSEFIITPRLDAWLTANTELVLTDDDVDLLRKLLTTAGRMRLGTFTGSQAGDCERRQVFRYLGVPALRKVDPVLQNRFFDGTWRHLRMQFTLRHAIPGLIIESPVQANKYRFLGAIDGWHPTELWGWEYKGTSVFSKVVANGVMDPHKMQAVRYWLATDSDPNYPRLEAWVFVYEDKRTNEWKEVVVRRNDPEVQRLFKIVRTELRYLNESVDNQVLPQPLQECERAKGQTFRECPWSHVCLGQQWTAPPQDAPVVFSRRRKQPHHSLPQGGS